MPSKINKFCGCCNVKRMANLGASDEYCTEVFQRVTALTQGFQDALLEFSEDKEMQKQLIREYLRGSYTFGPDDKLGKPRHPVRLDITEDYQWVNSDKPREYFDSDAASNMMIFDFFTHCCINCIHSIEDLRDVHEKITSAIEQKKVGAEDNFRCGFQLFSIHSPKFSTEKEVVSIKSFVEKMKMNHTQVLNDPGALIWQKFGLYCWPTVFVFGPNVNSHHPGPNLLFIFTGEGHKDLLLLILDVALDFFNEHVTLSQVEKLRRSLKAEQLKPELRTVNDEKTKVPSLPSLLNFPGKVSVRGEKICISDSGNNRIHIVGLRGDIVHTIGGTERGYADGDFSIARFSNPQGTAFRTDNVFFVADTGNHCIRMVDLQSKVVTTLVRPNHPVPEPHNALKSPWDLCFYDNDTLLVAAAGNHQIFGYFFQSKTLFRVQHLAECFDLIAGTGKEENRNNSYILKSSFAQPSGICCSGEEGSRYVFIADSESSSVRLVDPDGKVLGIVGGNRDPTDLFTYGDEDGISYGVKLQHPMGVCAPHRGKIYVADTYNHKIKRVKIETKHCRTLIGDGKAGNTLGVFTGSTEPKRLGVGAPSPLSVLEAFPVAQFNEPAGVAVDDNGEYLFIADTNNHVIKVAHLRQNLVSELKLHHGETVDSSQRRPSRVEVYHQQYNFKMSKSVRTFRLTLVLHNIPHNYDGGFWKVVCPIYSLEATDSGNLQQGTLHGTISIITQDIPYVPWMREAYAIFNVLLCGSSACVRKIFRLRLHFEPCEEDSGETAKSLKVEFTPNKNEFHHDWGI